MTTKLQEIQLVVLRWGRFLFWGEGGLVILQMGRVRIRKKKEKWGTRVSAEWPYIHFCRRHYRRFYSIGETIGYSDGQSTRHRTDLLFKSLCDSIGIFNGAPVTSPVRIWHFKSVGMFWRWTGPITRTGPSFYFCRRFRQKNHPPKPPRHCPPFFHQFWIFGRSVITDLITDENFPSVLSAEKYRQKKFHRYVRWYLANFWWWHHIIFFICKKKQYFSMYFGFNNQFINVNRTLVKISRTTKILFCFSFSIWGMLDRFLWSACFNSQVHECAM